MYLRCDIELVAVESNPLKVGQQILFGVGLRTLISNLPRQFVKFCAGLRDLFGRVNNGHSRLKWPTTLR